MDAKRFIQHIKEFFAGTGITQAVVGLSGGVDSALTCTLLVHALGAENVHGLLMPEKGLSSQQNIDDAQMLARQLGVKTDIVYINDFLEPLSNLPWTQNHTAAINSKARVRMLVLYNYANTHRCLVAGTSNKTEILLGYGTKYGDAAADVYIIGDLLKKEVFALAKELGVPETILKKTPTAELFAGQTDEGELGMTYTQIDAVLEELTLGREQLAAKYGEETVEKIFKRVADNKHKSGIVTIKKSTKQI